jgi:hypothetical protein
MRTQPSKPGIEPRGVRPAAGAADDVSPTRSSSTDRLRAVGREIFSRIRAWAWGPSFQVGRVRARSRRPSTRIPPDRRASAHSMRPKCHRAKSFGSSIVTMRSSSKPGCLRQTSTSRSWTRSQSRIRRPPRWKSKRTTTRPPGTRSGRQNVLHQDQITTSGSECWNVTFIHFSAHPPIARRTASSSRPA